MESINQIRVFYKLRAFPNLHSKLYHTNTTHNNERGSSWNVVFGRQVVFGNELEIKGLVLPAP